MMPGLSMSLLHGARPAPVSQTFTASGNFRVPAYSVLTIEIFGGVGLDQAPYTGGLGGRCFKTYNFGVGGPALDASIFITISNLSYTASKFGFGTNHPEAYTGTDAQEDVGGYWYSSGGDEYYMPPVEGSNGSPGTANFGDVNQTGVSPHATSRVILTWY